MVGNELYRARFDFAFPEFIEKDAVGKDWLLHFRFPQLSGRYSVYFSADTELGKQVLRQLRPGVRASVDGLVKIDKRGNIILRAKQIIVEDSLGENPQSGSRRKPEEQQDKAVIKSEQRPMKSIDLVKEYLKK